MSSFARYIGIDYSGAKTPTSSLTGLRVYLAEKAGKPPEEEPPPSPRYWTRKGIAEWLVETLTMGEPALVGIDHAFSFPQNYFDQYGLHDWPSFLDDFQHHWPTDQDHAYVDFFRNVKLGKRVAQKYANFKIYGTIGNGAARTGDSRWRRLTEVRAGGAKSVFHFDVPGQVAKSSHAGIPWLRFIRQRLGARVHFWPFDGWDIPAGRSAIVEVYPALWNRDYPPDNRTPDQHDAFSVAAWLASADRNDSNGRLSSFLKPALTPSERTVAEREGWILGVPLDGTTGS